MTWAALGFISGLVLTAKMQVVWQIVVVTLFLLLVRSFQHNKHIRILLIFFCMFLLGSCHWSWQIGQHAPGWQQQIGQSVTVSGTVLESRAGQAYFWLEATKQNGKTLSCQERFCVILPQVTGKGKETAQKNNWYPPGSSVTVSGELAVPQGQRNPGGFNEQQWLCSKKVTYKLLADTVLFTEPPTGIWQLSLQAHHFMEQTVVASLSEQEAATALALLLGEKQLLDQEFYRLTQRMGIAHIFAVSGLHVGFAGSLFLVLFKLCGWERSWLSFILLFVGLSFYCILTGLPPSALRAATMILLAALGLRLQRPIASIDFLAAAAMFVLLENPFLLWTAGFQLSFGVTLSLLLFAAPLQQTLSWIPWPWLRSGISVAIAADIGSLPLSAWHFYTVSLLAPVFNLILVPVVSILVPVLLISFLLVIVFPAGHTLFFFPAHCFLQVVLQGTKWLQQILGSGQWYVGRPGFLALSCYLCFCFIFWRILKRRETIYHKEQFCALGLLLLAIWFGMPHSPTADTLLYLDTGQGSCAVLRTKAGETVIFDGGAQQRELASCLAWYGVNRVKAIVLSHGDTDHITGVTQVLENVSVEHLLLEKQQMKRETVVPLLTAAQKQGTDVRAIGHAATLRLKQGQIVLRVHQDGTENNNSSELTAILRNDYGIVAFPGDLSVQGVQNMIQAEPRIDVWTVPHHGSRNSANEELYQQLQQKGVRLAVISAGKENRYGHPHAEVLQFLQQVQIPWQRTDENGAIQLILGKKQH